MKNYTLIVGDWSGDGHGVTKTFLIRANHDPERVYSDGVDILNFDLEKECDDYEEDYIDLGWYYFLNVEPIEGWVEYEGIDHNKKIRIVSAKLYVDLYLAICKVGNKDFKFEIVDDEFPSINIGGYGLMEFSR